jgi:hypothetical protein
VTSAIAATLIILMEPANLDEGPRISKHQHEHLWGGIEKHAVTSHRLTIHHNWSTNEELHSLVYRSIIGLTLLCPDVRFASECRHFQLPGRVKPWAFVFSITLSSRTRRRQNETTLQFFNVSASLGTQPTAIPS